MTGRRLLAGFLATVAMMVWTSLAHVVLPLGQVGFDNMPAEAATLPALHAAMGERPGLYMFPGYDMHAPDANKAMAEYAAKTRTNPSGFIVYRAAGHDLEMGTSALQEFGKLVVVAFVLAWLLAQATALRGFAARVGFVTAIGGVATLTTNASYLFWYGFPLSYTLAQFLIDIVAFLLAGLVLAALVKPPKVLLTT